MVKSLLPNEVKINITNDDVRQKSNLTTNKIIKFIKKFFCYTFIGFSQSHSGEIGDIGGFVQLLPGTYKSDKPVHITGIIKIYLKCECIQGSIVNGTSEPILYIFAFSSPPCYKSFREPRIKLS